MTVALWSRMNDEKYPQRHVQLRASHLPMLIDLATRFKFMQRAGSFEAFLNSRCGGAPPQLSPPITTPTSTMPLPEGRGRLRHPATLMAAQGDSVELRSGCPLPPAFMRSTIRLGTVFCMRWGRFCSWTFISPTILRIFT